MDGLFRVTPTNAGGILARILEIESLSFPTPWSPQAFCDELRNPASGVWGYAEHDTLWGYVCWGFTGGSLRIRNIAVHPARRNRGLGTLLLEKAVQVAWAGGSESVRLEVRTSNRPAQRLYSKRGFRETGRRHGYYRDTGEDAILMELEVAQQKRKPGVDFHEPQSGRVSTSLHSSLEV
jgi:[ribosomal protein S18]-alanine N-acetyltransferase